MPFSPLVNRSARGNEGPCAVPPPRNLPLFSTHRLTLLLRQTHLLGYPGHQASRRPAGAEVSFSCKWMRIFSMTPASLLQASTFRAPPHALQASMSML